VLASVSFSGGVTIARARFTAGRSLMRLFQAAKSGNSPISIPCRFQPFDQPMMAMSAI
jgi:hypothetical protein